MSTVASMLNMAAQQTISGIDQQIAAEKERDGKSEESKKKIQKLEAEKAAAQKKA
ncbi:pore-forming tail tip protein [Aeromonas phage AhSzq-1]|uniref:Pore-forming tail tip protein n=2 Tax=Shenzhenvirus TaxID=2732038 RepID=A0A2R4ALT8_9CAUD|nr:tail length tape measure protein [Aeromonas phage AhSzq-1]YP_009800314.1 tail length tape measure protein [Aeromonas phage AhSzw-1]AVR76011.1 pore-forming tail tip protein [Aeromonas phage AhSzq-1]AVR76157.1 pore-forming tail tip protein [Aeromonas phage AhSzw-1]